MQAEPPKPRRRFRIHLSLRATMVLVLLLGVGLGWGIVRGKISRDAVAAIRAAGGEVYYDWDWRPGAFAPRVGTCPWPRWLVGLVGVDILADVSLVALRGDRAAPVDDALIAQVARLGRLRGFWLRHVPQVSDASLSRIAGLDRLVELDLTDSGVPGPSLRHLARLTRLETLHLTSSPTDADLAPIGRMTALRTLTFPADLLTDAGLAGLSGLVNLRYLSLCKQFQFPGDPPAHFATLEPLRGMKALQTLFFDSTAVTSLEPLSGSADLQALYPGKSPIDDAGLAPIARLGKLISTRIDSPSLTDAGLAAFSGLGRLRSLVVSSPNVTDAGLVALTGLPALTDLTLSCPRLTDLGLARLAAMPRLMSLGVHSPGVTDLGLAPIARHPQIISLSLDRTSITDAGLAALGGLPRPSSLSLRETALTDAALPTLLAMPGLIQADLSLTRVTSAGVAAAKAARPALTIMY